jgi:hypothetical protein
MTFMIPIILGNTKSNRSTIKDIKFENLNLLTDGGLIYN